MEKITGILAVAAAVIILLFVSCNVVVNAQDNSAMKAMVLNGSDPIDARCAVKGSYDKNPTCAIRAASKGHSK